MSIGHRGILAAALMGMVAVAEQNNKREGKKVLVVDAPDSNDGSTGAVKEAAPNVSAQPKEEPMSKNTKRQRKFMEMLGVGGPQNFQFADDTVQGVRQGERIAKGKHDFSASDRCIERIKARNAAKAAKDKA